MASARSQLHSWLCYFIDALIWVQKLTQLSFSFSQEIARPDPQNVLPPSVSLVCVDPVTPAPDIFPP